MCSRHQCKFRKSKFNFNSTTVTMRCYSGIVLLFYCICTSISVILSFQIPIQSHQYGNSKNPNFGLLYQYQNPRNSDLLQYQNTGGLVSNYGVQGIERRNSNYYQNDSTSLTTPDDDDRSVITFPMLITTEAPYSEPSIPMDDDDADEKTSIESPLLLDDMELDESSNEIANYYYPYPVPYPYYYPTSSGVGVPVPVYQSGLQGHGPPQPQGQVNNNNNNQGGPHPQGRPPGNSQGQSDNQALITTTEQPEEEPTTTETPTTTLAPFTLADVKIPTPFLRIELMICFTILGAIYGFGFMVLFQSLCVPAAKIAVFVVYSILLKLKAIQPVSLAAALEQLPPN